MPRIRIATPSSAATIAAHAREYAILQQVKPDAEGAVDAQALEEYLKLYGSDKKGGNAAGEAMSFEEFVALFAKPGSAQGTNCLGWAALDKSTPLGPYSFDRRPVGPKDVRIQITHAGICHSDIHQARDEWTGSVFPMVPGHEIVGIVTEVGPQVTKFKLGDRAGVGCMVNSCGSCSFCNDSKEEQFCSGAAFTYNYKYPDGTIQQGGYSTHIVVTECFALRIPESLPLGAAAPLLCAGITTYSPLRNHKLDRPGVRLGVVGLGGLGHVAVRLAKAMGCHVTVISTSPGKRDEAINVLGADAFLLSNDAEAMKAAGNTLDGILDTVSAKHDLEALSYLVKVDGKIILLGIPPQATPFVIPAVPIVFRRVGIVGSVIGGIAQTQEMLDFCAEHNVTAMIETIPIDKVNEAYDRMLKNDVKYRFVIDIQGSLVA